MFLKRLELQGFKSFADKTTLDFPSNVAAIVGPNGSGKSNVTDGIRWLLGERDAKNLRGGKVEDLIFAGTEKRAKLGLAQASLYFDNSSGFFPVEFKEVVISRRVSRDGVSQFFLKQVCVIAISYYNKDVKQTKKSKIKEKKETNIRNEVRGIGVVIERIDDKVSLVAEQYGDIKKILDSHTKILDSHTEMIGSMKMDIEVIKADISFIKGGLKRKVDADEFSVLERRVALLEKRR